MARLDLEGTTALVTGASSGIGAALTHGLARRGAERLILVARSRDRLEALAAELPCEGIVEPLDLTDPEAVDALVARHPQVDVLVNNAGFGQGNPLLETNAADALVMVDLNCRAPLQLIRAWLPGMVERGRGGVLNVGSVAGYGPLPGMAAYSGTKAFLFLLSERLRIETRGTGVPITLLSPGPVDTPFFEVAYEGQKKPPAWLFTTPEAVAEAGLRGLERDRAVVLPGWLARLMAWHGRLSPLWLQRPVMRIYLQLAEWWLKG